MSFTPARRLAAVATATAILATTVLIPAAAMADELPAEEATAALVAETPAEAPEPAPEEPASEEPAPQDAASEDPAPEAPASVEPALVEPVAPVAPKMSAKTEPAPLTSLVGTASTIAAGQTWTAQTTVDDATSLRAVAIGADFVLTITDSAGATRTVAAAGGYVDIWLATAVPDGTVDLAIRNTASVAQSIPYAFGWETADIRSTSVMSEGQPNLGVSTYPSRGGVTQTASGNARVIGLDRVVHTLPLGGPSYRADFEGLAPGLYVVEVDMIVLGVHRVSARVSRVSATETTPPTVAVATSPTSPAPGGWYPGAVQVTITASDSGAGLHFLHWGVDTTQLDTVNTERVTTTISAEGTHQVRYEAEDWQGNRSGVATRQINIDRTVPVVALNGVADGDEFDQDELVAIEYSCDDALSGIQSCVGDLGSGDFLDTATPGAHSIRVTATDRAGNEVFVERSYTVLAPDTTDPVVTLDVPADPASGWYLDSVTVGITASDASGIRRIHYEYDTMQGTVSRDIEADTASVTFDRTQLYTLEYWAEDAAGNRSEGEHLQLSVDADAPWVNLMSPQELPSILPNGHYAEGEIVEVDYTCDDSGSGIASCEGSIDDGENLPTDVPGAHALTIVAIDVAGHRTERVVEYIVDAAPEAEPGPGPGPGPGSDPETGAGTAGTPRLAATGTDLAVTIAALAAGLMMVGALALTVRRTRRS